MGVIRLCSMHSIHSCICILVLLTKILFYCRALPYLLHLRAASNQSSLTSLLVTSKNLVTLRLFLILVQHSQVGFVRMEIAFLL